MAPPNLHEFWRLVAAQHGVVARWQLLELGFSADEIKRRVRNGRLHPLWRGVYAVGRPHVTREGCWMAATLACGPSAVLSHASAAARWEVGEIERGDDVEVSVPNGVARRRPGIRVHRRLHLPAEDVATCGSVPVTSPLRTLIDLAPRLSAAQLERMINEASGRGIVDVDVLRASLDERAGQHGVAKVARVIDRRTFRLTRSGLERLFLPLAAEVGLPPPATGRRLNGYETDFFWEDIGLVVEVDGLRYHRTPAQQARDRLRDQAHTAAGLTPLRFTHAQVRYERSHVARTLRIVAARLRANS